jgi:hypothetical protein
MENSEEDIRLKIRNKTFLNETALVHYFVFNKLRRLQI